MSEALLKIENLGTRFEVPSEAAIAAIDDRTLRIKTESARGRAIEDMREWQPYAIYSTGVGIVMFLGTAIATVLGARAVWRGVNRDSTRKAGHIVVAVLLIMLAGLALFGWPPLVAQRQYDAEPTAFAVNTPDP